MNRVLMWQINISEDHAASVLTLKMESARSYSINTWRYNP